MDNNNVETIVTELVSHPRFGDWRYITNEILMVYDYALELVRDQVPSAGKLHAALSGSEPVVRYLISTDPVFRTTLDTAVELLEKQGQVGDSEYQLAEDVCANMVELAKKLKLNPTYTPMQAFGVGLDSDKYIGKPPLHIVCWHPQSVDSPLGFADRFYDLFDHELADRVDTSRAIMRPLTHKFHSGLSDGLDLLYLLSPELTKDALAHVKVIGIIDLPNYEKISNKERPSFDNVSTHQIPGSIFLSSTPLRHPVHTAEAILHEASHNKLSNLVSTTDIYVDGYDAETGQTVHAFWNPDLSRNSSQWPVDRAIHALHVYVHLAVYYSLVSNKWDEIVSKFGDPGDFDLTKRVRRHSDRARYLYEELIQIEDGSLGAAGKEILAWLGAAVSQMDSNPPLQEIHNPLGLKQYLFCFAR